jgi:hypothetical protein
LSYIKRHSTFPYLEFSFADASGNAIDCTNYQVKLLSMNKDKEVIIDAIVDATGSGAVWTDVTGGTGEYHWQTGDTDDVGVYKYEFEFIRMADDKIFTVPETGFFTYTVKEDIESLPD